MIVKPIACQGDVGPQDPGHLPVAGGTPLSRAHWMSVTSSGWAFVGHTTIVASPRFSTDRAAPGSASLHGLAIPTRAKETRSAPRKDRHSTRICLFGKKSTFLSSVLLMRESACNGVTGS